MTKILGLGIEIDDQNLSIKGTTKIRAQIYAKLYLMPGTIYKEWERKLQDSEQSPLVAYLRLEAFLANGSTQRFIARRYGTTESNLCNWIKKHELKRAKI